MLGAGGAIFLGALTPALADGQHESLEQATVVGKRDVDEMPLASFSKAREAFALGRAHAPNASLRFVVIPRNANEPMLNIHLLIEDPRHSDLAPVKVALADDGSFTLPRHRRRLVERSDGALQPAGRQPALASARRHGG